MKATPSQDGKNRFDIRIKHRAGAEEVIVTICFMLADEPSQKFNRKTVLRELKYQIAKHGDSLWAHQEGGNETQALAVELAKKLFPELYLP